MLRSTAEGLYAYIRDCMYKLTRERLGLRARECVCVCELVQSTIRQYGLYSTRYANVVCLPYSAVTRQSWLQQLVYLQQSELVATVWSGYYNMVWLQQRGVVCRTNLQYPITDAGNTEQC